MDDTRPFRRRRAANGQPRYLNTRERAMPRTMYRASGNRTHGSDRDHD